MCSKKITAKDIAIDLLSSESQKMMQDTKKNHQVIYEVLRKMNITNAKQYAALTTITLMNQEIEKIIINPANYVHRISANLINTTDCESLVTMQNLEKTIANRLAIMIIKDLNMKNLQILDDVVEILMSK